MSLLAVNFHYISNNRYKYPGIHPVTPEEFEKQLDELGRFFTFVSQEEIDSSIKEKTKLPESSCLITFDDGLNEQFEFGWSILNRKGIPGVFFVNTNNRLKNEVSLVHKIHLLRSSIPPFEFLNEIKNICYSNDVKFDIESIDEGLLNNQYKYDSLEIKKIKFALNFILTLEERTKIIDVLFNKYYDNEGDIVNNFYMNTEQWKILAANGCLGTHSADHIPLGQFSYKEVFDNLKQSMDDIEYYTNFRPYTVSYPYGGKTTVNNDVVKAASDAGLSLGITMERAINENVSNSPLLLARLACNDAIGGKNPQFNILENQNNKFNISGNIAQKRNLWIQE